MFIIRRGGSYGNIEIAVDRDLRSYTRVVLTIIDAEGYELELDTARLAITANTVSFSLTDMETLSLSSGAILLQLRAKNSPDDALASEIMEAWAADALKGEALDID